VSLRVNMVTPPLGRNKDHFWTNEVLMSRPSPAISPKVHDAVTVFSAAFTLNIIAI